MHRTLCITVLALSVVPAFVVPSLAQKKSAGGSSLAAIQLECFKSQGAYLDPATKRYVMYGTEMDMQSKTDAVNKCVTEKTGKPATPFVRHQSLNQ